MKDKNCTYCNLILGKISSGMPLVYEDDQVFAFLAHVPVNPGHAVVLSKEHCLNPSALPELVAGRMFYVASRIGVACRMALDADGFNVIANDGFCSGQDIPHAHLHVIPRYLDDGFHLNWRILPEVQTDVEIAEKIKAKLKVDNIS